MQSLIGACSPGQQVVVHNKINNLPGLLIILQPICAGLGPDGAVTALERNRWGLSNTINTTPPGPRTPPSRAGRTLSDVLRSEATAR